jgi:endonuclease III
MTIKTSLTLCQTVEELKQYYGSPEHHPTSDPFELVLWVNVAYLASPSRRLEAFELLRNTIGTDPIAILTAEKEALENVAAQGILKNTFAGKLRECAHIVVDDFGGELGPVIRGPLENAKRALQSFPGIGEPGAEKILLFTGRQALLAPDSNGLRVLVRLGLVREEKSYARTYAASRAVAKDYSADPVIMQEAHLLLQQHGQTLCKRKAPNCEACPLAPKCPYSAIILEV